MKYIYALKIDCEKDKLDDISRVLNLSPSSASPACWSYELVEKEKDPPVDFVNEFLDLLDGKFEMLREIGVEIEQISIWMYYEYDEQCNLEFLPKDLMRIGQSGISLCISCWQK